MQSHGKNDLRRTRSYTVAARKPAKMRVQTPLLYNNTTIDDITGGTGTVSSNASAAAAPGKDHKMSHSSHTVKQTGQELGCKIIPRFRILIASVVKICKQRLHTVSASGGLQTPTGTSLVDPWRLSSPDTLSCSPRTPLCTRWTDVNVKLRKYSTVMLQIPFSACVGIRFYCYRNSVRLSVCHTGDPGLNSSLYRNMFAAQDRVIFRRLIPKSTFMLSE